MPQLNQLEAQIKTELEAYRKYNVWYLRLFRPDTWGNRNLTRVDRALRVFQEKEAAGGPIPLNQIMGILLCRDTLPALSSVDAGKGIYYMEAVDYNSAGNDMIGSLWHNISNCRDVQHLDSFFYSNDETVSELAQAFQHNRNLRLNFNPTGLSLALFWPQLVLDNLKALFTKFVRSSPDSVKHDKGMVLGKLLNEEVFGNLGYYERRDFTHKYESFPPVFDKERMTTLLDTLESLDDPWTKLEALEPVRQKISKYQNLANNNPNIRHFLDLRQPAIDRIETMYQTSLSSPSISNPDDVITPQKYTKSWEGLLRLRAMGIPVQDFEKDIDFVSVFSSGDALRGLADQVSHKVAALDPEFTQYLVTKFKETIRNLAPTANSSIENTETLLERLCQSGENNTPGVFASFFKNDNLEKNRVSRLLGILDEDTEIQDKLVGTLLPPEYQTAQTGPSSSEIQERAADKIERWFHDKMQEPAIPDLFIVQHHLHNKSKALLSAPDSEATAALVSFLHDWEKILQKNRSNGFRLESWTTLLQHLNLRSEEPLMQQFVADNSGVLKNLLESYIYTLGHSISYSINSKIYIDAVMLTLKTLNNYPEFFQNKAAPQKIDLFSDHFIGKILNMKASNRDIVLSYMTNECSDALFKRILTATIKDNDYSRTASATFLQKAFEASPPQAFVKRAKDLGLAKKSYVAIPLSSTTENPSAFFPKEPRANTSGHPEATPSTAKKSG
jgi:hypothetical protein